MREQFHRIYSQPAPPQTITRRRPAPRHLAIGAIVLVLAGVIVLIVRGGDGDQPSRAVPVTARGGGPKSPAQSSPRPVFVATGTDIDNEKTDRGAVTVKEIFPKGRVKLSGRTFVRDKAALTPHCEWTARGVLAAALVREGCRSVVRATFVEEGRKFAVTAGVATLPTFEGARAAAGFGDPGGREWFRGMRGRTAEHIDEAKGRADYTVRGRYIVFVFTTYDNGRPPDQSDSAMAEVGKAFVGYLGRPLSHRADD
jgi:hypothetical protein